MKHKRKPGERLVKKDTHDSSSEDSAANLPVEQALSLFRNFIRSDAQSQKVVKKRKLDPKVTKNRDGTVSLGRNSDGHIPGPAKEKAAETTQFKSSPKATQKGESAKKRRHQLDGPDTTEAWDTMQQHASRKLDEASIAQLGSEKWRANPEEQFNVAWSEASWMVTGGPLPQVADSLEDYGVRPRLISLWQAQHQENEKELTSHRQRCMLALMRSYKDILCTSQPYPQRADEPDEVVDAALLHCLDHVAATAQRIKKNNDALKAKPDLDVPQDQGFTRPKVLILLPMRNQALKVISRLLSLAIKETRSDSVQKKSRFLKEFEDQDEPDESGKLERPAEHVALFQGNTDDYFSLGIKLTRGAIKLYSDFYEADIIVASPIALVTKPGDEGAQQDLDYLSSIEIVVAPRCDVLLMQNWAHVQSVFEAINQVPSDSHGGDVMRVQEWHLAGHAKYYRQNILLSSFASPDLNALFNKYCHSHAGKAKLQSKFPGVLSELKSHQIRQMFQRFNASSPADEPQQRFAFFKSQVWPRLRDSGTQGQMIFVATYFDYVRLRELLREEEVGFEGLTEYAEGSDVARGRNRFATGKTRIAIYTERSHFYHRRRTKGVKDLLFYQLPQHAAFYTELVNLLIDDDLGDSHGTVTVLFSKLDTLRLEGVVGSARARKMLANKSGSFLFC